MTSNENSPARGLKHVLSLKRQSRDDVSSINSDGKSPRRSSTDSTTNKLKAMITNIVHDDAESSDGKRSAKSLLGFGKLKDRARRKSQVVDPQEELRGRDTEPKQTVSNTISDESSEPLHDDDNSLLISEPETEFFPEKPPLVNHASHIGYLTASSPQIQAVVVPAESPVSQSPVTSPTKLKRLLGKSLTMPVSRSPSVSPSRPIPGVAALGINSPGLTPPTSNTSQTNNSRSPSPSSGRDLVKPASTIAARRKSRGSETANLPALQLSRGLTSASDDSVPSIITIPDTPPHSGTVTSPKVTPPARAATAQEDFSHRPLAAKSLATHRRIRSDGPPTSKLSQSMAPPLTPLEEARTPAGSRHVSGASTGGGFFSSVFNVAQNAANTLTNTLQTTTRPKTSASNKSSVDKVDPLEQGESTEEEEQEPARPLAIDTMGSGDLGLHHLGIETESQDGTGSPMSSLAQMNADLGRSRSNTVIHNEQASARAEGESAARAVSAAYSTTEDIKPAVTPSAEDVATPRPRPASMIDMGTPEAKVPVTPSIVDDPLALARSGSIRSKLGSRRKRHRNSSGTTIGAAIAASHSALAPSNANKFIGFTKANAKRNKDFHNFFRSVPDDDDLIEDYSCALQRDIILAGRIYISEGHVCFSSNILGWVTNLVISFEEIVSVEKESTAMLFANAIAIQTLHARHTFRSLLSRDATYDLIVNIWRLNHPGLESSENGLRLASGTGSKTQRIMNGSGHGSDGSLNSNDSQDETDSQDSRSFLDSVEASVNGEEPASRKVSAFGTDITSQPTGTTSTGAAISEKLASSVGSLGDYPGPSTHLPTECNDSAAHLEKLLKDDIIQAPLGKVYSLVFGPASTTFMTRWLQDEVRVTDFQMEDTRGLSESNKSRSFTYIKPLTNPIGPRTTKCVITEHLDFLDLEKAMTVSVTTQTPDVPSGNLFSTKTKYCLMWGPNNSTRIIMTYNIEWTGKSWLKGPIEKGATDGQTAYANDLVKALKNGVSPRGRSVTQGSKNKKIRRRRSEGDALKQDVNSKPSAWGPFQPLHDRITATIRRVKPLFSIYSIVVILLFLLIVSWSGNLRFRNTRVPFLGSSTGANSRIPYSSRVAAWEDRWLSEEEALWEWLQVRTGLTEGLTFPNPHSLGSQNEESPGSGSFLHRSNKRSTTGKDLEWAIKITEDRLASLKQKVGGPQGQKSSPSQEQSKMLSDDTETK